MKKQCLIKVSGDLVNNPGVISQILNESEKYMIVYVHGAGKQFNEASKEAVSFDENGNRIASQKQLEEFYYGPQQKIRDYLHSVFGDKINVISPITEMDGVFENINADERFKKIYTSGFFEKGIIYTKDDRDKSHLQLSGVEIRYI